MLSKFEVLPTQIFQDCAAPAEVPSPTRVSTYANVVPVLQKPALTYTQIRRKPRGVLNGCVFDHALLYLTADSAPFTGNKMQSKNCS